jgi:hypothetical protein
MMKKTKRFAKVSRPWVYVLGTFLLSLASLLGFFYAKSEHIILGAEAYIFGYPLVMMDLTRTSSVISMEPENKLHRVRKFPEASFKEVVRPNVDTLYTTAFIDMAQGPWVFEMAPNQQRYEVMPFMDAWTNVFAAPGTRSAGTAGGRYLLVGPQWTGPTPAGLTLLRSPTQMVWLIGRTQTNGEADYALVHQLQDGLQLRHLTEWSKGNKETRLAWQAPTLKPMPPSVQMEGMGTVEFFNKLSLLMVTNPPSAADGPMLMKLARLGLAPGQAIQWTPLDRWALSLGRWIADWKVGQELKKPRDLVKGWSTPPAILGNYGTSYNIRAVVAKVGLGANLPDDAIYPSTRVDSTGLPLDGRHRYRLHFEPNALPPVHAFWSVTAYGVDDFLIENPIHRYALGDRDALAYNPDGSLDLWIQSTPPQGTAKSNWLPVKNDASFLLNARLYWPKTAALQGGWGMPAVERLD